MCFTCNPHQLVLYELLLTTGPLVFVYAFMGTDADNSITGSPFPR